MNYYQYISIAFHHFKNHRIDFFPYTVAFCLTPISPHPLVSHYALFFVEKSVVNGNSEAPQLSSFHDTHFLPYVQPHSNLGFSFILIS